MLSAVLDDQSICQQRDKYQAEPYEYTIYMSVTKVLKKCASKSKSAALAELQQQILDQKVWENISKANSNKK